MFASPLSTFFHISFVADDKTTGAIRCAKLQSNCHDAKTNTQFSAGRMHFLEEVEKLLCTWSVLHLKPNAVMVGGVA